MRKYSQRDPKEYNIFRALFQRFVTRFGYANLYRFTCGYKVYGRENLPKKDEFYIVASNHVSAVDPFLMCDAIEKPLAFMAKKELFDGFWKRVFMDFMGAFEVDRGKIQVSTMKTALGIKDAKCKLPWKLALFPQGTREREGSMENVNKGFAVFAKKLKCSIVPVGIIGANYEDRHTRGADMSFVIGKPIPYNENVDEMIEIWKKEVTRLSNKEEFDKKYKPNYARRTAKEYNWRTKLWQLWAYMVVFWVCTVPFYKFVIKGRENLKTKEKLTLAPNHVSYLDPLLIAKATHRFAGYMAKKELFEGKGFGGAWLRKNILRLGAFAVDREKPETATIKTALEVYKAGWDLCIFPQGGIRKNKRIEAINKGFIALARKGKADIVPISISGLETYNWNIFKRRRVEVNIGEPISRDLPDDEIIRIWRERVADMAGYELAPEG